MSIDNPYYFYNEKSPKTSDTSSRGFSFFRRRNSKSSPTSSSPKIPVPQLKSSLRTFNSATLSQDAAILGSPRGSLGSLGSFNQVNENQLQTGLYRSSSGDGSGSVNAYRGHLDSYNESLSYSENDDVFLQSNSNRSIVSRTLPTIAITNSNRRHSLGHVVGRERGRCNSFCDEVPKMIAPKPPSVALLKYHTHRQKESCGNSNMDDILIVTTKHSERAILWANFLKNRFDKITKQRGRKPFNFLHIKIDEGPFPNELIQKCLQTALQIIVLCPAFLSLSHSYLMTQLSTILNPEKVLGILLEVSEDKVLEIHKAALPSFRKWKKCAIRDNDHSLMGNILGIATDILGRALCQRPPCQESNNGNVLKSTSSEEFTVVPRKVKIGQNKILILLNEPLQKDDWIKINIEKSGEILEVNNFKKRNPYTIQFNIPESCMEISTMIEIHVEKNEKTLGNRLVKCESRLREMEQLLRTQDSPIEFMCHSLGIGSTDRDSLDIHLLQCFQKNMPSNFHLLSGSYEKQNNFIFYKETRPEEYPTLLHFAAKWGLERLCLQLLECPGGDSACEMKNCSGKTPADIAEQEGFNNIAKSFKSFSQIHEFATMYHYFKGISDSNGNNNKVVIEPQILTVDIPSTTIKTDDKKSQKQSTDEDVVDRIEGQTEYMEMNSGSEGESSTRPTLAVTNLNYINVEIQEDCNLQSSNELIKKVDQIKIIEDREITSNQMHFIEPQYYPSNENNKTGDEFSEECSNALENFNTVGVAVSSQQDYIIQPSNIPISTIGQDQGNYMIQPSNRPIENENVNYKNEPAIVYQTHYTHHQHHPQQMMLIQKDDDSHLMMSFEKNKRNKNGTLKRTGSDTSAKGNADDELVEIMYDFKNNVLTIREVEQLVEKWKNRNDVKQSFKEKQEQIEKLREEYERVQEQMKAKMKRPTPFDRVKKLFSRSKHNSNQKQQQLCGQDTDDTKLSVTTFQSSQRPISTLSLQSVSSSSSSGRMSTVSACSGVSLGDSGTHSDQEERRQIINSNCRIGLPGSLMENYMIPPTPRPVVTPASTPTPVEEKDGLIFMTNDRNSVTSTSPTLNLSEHYMIFPSNMPVFNNNQNIYSSNNNGNNNSNNIDSSTFGGLNTIIETKETLNDTTCISNNTVKSIKVQNNNNNNNYMNDTNNIIFSKNKNFRTLNPLVNEYSTFDSQNALKHTVPSSTSSPLPPLSSSSSSLSSPQLIDVKKEMSEVYKNINGLTDKTMKLANNMAKLIQSESKKFSRQNSCENNSLVIDCSSNSSIITESNKSIIINNDEIDHNYMNI